MAELTIAASVAHAMIEFAVSKGASRRRLAERSGIDPAELEDRDNRIAFSKYVALTKAGQELCHDPALALHFGEAIDLTDVSFTSQIDGGAATWGESAAQANRYAPLIVEVDAIGDRFVLTRRDGQLWMIDTRKNPNDFPELTESTFARAVCSCRRRAGDLPLVKAVHVTHAAPPYRAEYDRIFRAPVTFESDTNALVTDESVLANLCPQPPRHVSEILAAHAEAQLERLELAKSTRGRVESLMTPALPNGGMSMDATARTLGLSRQSLFRKLKAEGVTFSEVVDDLRQKMARHYLNGAKASVNETAYLVGFSDPAAFSRAFKRWTGSSPRGPRKARSNQVKDTRTRSAV
jgi:AraC-like DNA-binding protein